MKRFLFSLSVNFIRIRRIVLNNTANSILELFVLQQILYAMAAGTALMGAFSDPISIRCTFRTATVNAMCGFCFGFGCCILYFDVVAATYAADQKIYFLCRWPNV